MNDAAVFAFAWLCIGSCAARVSAQTMNVEVGAGSTGMDSIIFVDVLNRTPLSWGAEASVAGDIEGSQSARATFTTSPFVNSQHDAVLSGTIKLRTALDGRLQVAAVGGLGVARRQTNRVGTSGAVFPRLSVTPFQETESNFVPAATGGVDCVVAVRPHIGILLVGRVHYLFDNDRLTDGVVHSGVSSVILWWGAGALIRF